ncbi:hypothetical protein [Amycolatopsis pigmentata]|uniref:Uncharacterized protein n=1 Tax=Amycolatopsis pigmentata TaxID=450801 RepID=A0ABW5FXC1_9PSEU
MSDEEIVDWALRLAKEVVPTEVELAPSMVVAYVAGGREREELFRTRGSVPSGFDVGSVLVVFPQILAGLAVAGHSLWNLLGGNASSVSTLLKNVGELWDRRKAARKGKTEQTAVADDPDLSRVIDAIETQLAAAGMAPADRELLTFRIVRALIADGSGTRAFLTAIRPPSAS